MKKKQVKEEVKGPVVKLVGKNVWRVTWGKSSQLVSWASFDSATGEEIGYNMITMDEDEGD